MFDFDNNPTLDTLMDVRNKDYFLRSIGVTRQQFDSNDDGSYSSYVDMVYEYEETLFVDSEILV